jgi:large subunit ribosomal protein L18e
MKSNTKISKQTERKTNPELVETIQAAKKLEAWREVASCLAGSRRNRININLSEINEGAEEGDVIVICGKVLSMGEVDKKIKVSALSYSEEAMQKLKEAKVEFNYIAEEIKSNAEAKGIKVVRK